MKKIIIMILLFAFLYVLQSCEYIQPKEEPKPTYKTVIVLYDLSDSTIDFRNDYYNAFDKILKSINHGDNLVVAKITDHSVSESVVPIDHTFPKFTPLDPMSKEPTDNDMLIKKAKAKADNEIEKEKEKLREDLKKFIFKERAKMTAIMSSLQVADRVSKSYKSDKTVLVIFSDMIEESSNYNFTKANLDNASIRKIIEKEAAAFRLPDLKGIKVYIASAAKDVNDNKYLNVQRFWLEYLKRCGADLKKENYGSSLVNFNE
ncbi:MAG: hypothetical protein HQK96_09400 [Nitrospirae bacterium]|nr:hypothetical protein [Nitrospirota bacterium]